MSNIRAIVFDMDGLLINSEPIYQAAWREGVAHFGYELTEEVNRSMLGLNNDDSEAVLIREFGHDFPMLEFREQWPQRWQDIASEKGIPPMPGAHDLLESLFSRDIPIAIATSSERHKVHQCLPAAEIHHEFHAIVCGPEVPNGKPAPDIYQHAAQALNVAPEECAALEDSNNGMRAALSAGMTAIMVPDLKDAEPDVADRAHYIVEHLDEAHRILLELLGFA